MGGRAFLGEFEQRVLLAILRCSDNPFPIEIRREVARQSGHDPSRGAFYTTLDRLEVKGLVRWSSEAGAAGRDGLPQRKFKVTPIRRARAQIIPPRADRALGRPRRNSR
ncbi:MAG: PadR family transcriptional regulator [Vicinamibacterales bacterium]